MAIALFVALLLQAQTAKPAGPTPPAPATPPAPTVQLSPEAMEALKQSLMAVTAIAEKGRLCAAVLTAGEAQLSDVQKKLEAAQQRLVDVQTELRELDAKLRQPNLSDRAALNQKRPTIADRERQARAEISAASALVAELNKATATQNQCIAKARWISMRSSQRPGRRRSEIP